MDYFSRRNLVEKVSIVMITRFRLRDFVIEIITSLLIPFSEKVLLKAFLITSNEKLVSILMDNLTRIRRFEACNLTGILDFGLFLTNIHF